MVLQSSYVNLRSIAQDVSRSCLDSPEDIALIDL